MEALETLAGDRLADHVDHLTAHAFRGEVWEKALRYCRQAGDKAYARSALREVVAYFEQALAAPQYLPRAVSCRSRPRPPVDLRNALLTLGEIRQVLNHLREAKTLAEALDGQPRLGRVSAFMCRYCTTMGDHEARSSPASTPSPSLRPSEISPCRLW